MLAGGVYQVVIVEGMRLTPALAPIELGVLVAPTQTTATSWKFPLRTTCFAFSALGQKGRAPLW